MSSNQTTLPATETMPLQTAPLEGAASPGTSTPPPGVSPGDVPRRAAGLELLGRYQGSGLTSPRFLVRRGDGQVAQLPELLYRTLEAVDGTRDGAAVAARLSAEHDLRIAPDQVATLLEDRLRPVGLLADPPDLQPRRDGTGAAAAVPRRPDPLLALRYRKAVLSASTVWRIAGLGRWLFATPVIVLALTAFGLGEALLLGRVGFAGLLAAGQSLAGAPAELLAVLGVIAAAGAFHEAGHVSAARKSGATPGRMGVGLYLAWPAFYSDVTDAYRLARRGRLRTDLGGVYFNAIAITALTAGYLNTGQGWLLAAVALLHVETAYQFLPSLRLDGHYILADLVGVPDLFSRLTPILKSLGRRPDHPLVRDLKPWVRRVITAWVFVVIPFLGYWAVLFVVLAPQLAPATAATLAALATDTAAAAHDAEPARMALDIVQIPLAILPWIGGILIVSSLARRLTRLTRAGIARLRTRPAAPNRDSGPDAAPRRRGRSLPRTAIAGAVLGVLLGAAATAGVLLGPGHTTGAQSSATTAAPAGPTVLYGRVLEVPDPATVVIDHDGHPTPVAVLGLDTSTTPPCARAQAEDFARRTLLGHTVTTVPDPTLTPDPGSYRAYVVLPDQLSYTDAALRAGWATAGAGLYRPGFLTEQHTATNQHRGMWNPTCNPSPGL